MQRVTIQSLVCDGGTVTINRPHLILGGVIGQGFYPPQDFTVAKPLEVYLDDASTVDTDLISEMEFRDAGTTYNFSVAGVGNLGSVIFLALKDIPR